MSETDPRKLKALLADSQATVEPDEDDEDETETAAADDGDTDDDTDDGTDDVTDVDSLTESFASAKDTLNAIVDDFRTGTDAQPKAGVETLEEKVDATIVHEFCRWTEEVGKSDFRKLGEALDLEDVDGFVGWCRAVRTWQESGGGETTMADEDDEDDADSGTDESDADEGDDGQAQE